ncbi:MAG TPA: hypothetical protein VHE79_02500 [Spirochaetia bacterium]
MAIAQKVYDFPMGKVEDRLVTYLRKSRGESTVADMIAGTGLPKYQVEQAAKVVLDEYAGRLKVTESGELLYYFPSGMHSTTRGLGPSLKRFRKAFARTAVRVLSFLFKIWIVAMLVGYFVAFVAIGLVAIFASFAASAANKDNRDRGDHGGGFGGMYLVMRLLDFILRMWFWSSILKDPRRKPKEGRAFYKSVFGFVFGEGDPNAGWDEIERKHVISYIRGHKGVITLEEFMALTGLESGPANALLNRYLLEFEGEPGVTDSGTVIYTFPALMRAAEAPVRGAGEASLLNPITKKLLPFSANKKKTNGWIIFFNAFNLAFGSYFLVIGLTQGIAALAKGGPALFSLTGQLLTSLGVANPLPGMEIGLGLVPVAFSLIFFLVPIFRLSRMNRRNAEFRLEALRKRIIAHIVSSPSHVDARDLRPTGTTLDPKNYAAVVNRAVEKLAAEMGAEPVVQEQAGIFAYRFKEIEREISDLNAYRNSIDLVKYDLGKTVFDSGK